MAGGDTDDDDDDDDDKKYVNKCKERLNLSHYLSNGNVSFGLVM